MSNQNQISKPVQYPNKSEVVEKEAPEAAPIKEIDGKKVTFIGAQNLDQDTRPAWEKPLHLQGTWKPFSQLKGAMYVGVNFPHLDKNDIRPGFVVRTSQESQLYFTA